MGLKEQWAEIGTGAKVLIGLVLFIGLIPLLVILAAIVASFVLGFGGGGEAAATPQASWGFNYTATNESTGELTITHEGGDSAEASKLAIEVDSRTVDWGTTGTVSVGDSTTVTVGPDERALLVWTGGDAESVLDDWDGRDP